MLKRERLKELLPHMASITSVQSSSVKTHLPARSAYLIAPVCVKKDLFQLHHALFIVCEDFVMTSPATSGESMLDSSMGIKYVACVHRTQMCHLSSSKR